MKTLPFRRQRIAILDPDLRSREHARRAIRATGHAPYVFASLEEMREIDVAERPYAMAYVGSPLGDQAVEQTVSEVRACLGEAVPLMLAVKPLLVRRTAQMPAGKATHVIPLQTRFSDLYRELSEFMWANGPHPHQSVLTWGALRFRPAAGTVQIGDALPMSLTMFHFELAIELFHNIGRTLTRARLNAMLAPPSRAISVASFQDGVKRLRQVLELQTPVAWQLHSLEGGAVRLDAIPEEASPSTSRASALRAAGRGPSNQDAPKALTAF